MPFLQQFSLALAVIIVVVEIILGVMLLLGYLKRTTLWLLLLMIVFFTFLTFYSAYFNKVTDCGCFGDALIISNWDTFFKNIVLLLFAIILFVYYKRIVPFYTNKLRKSALVFVFLFCLLFVWFV